MTQFCQERKVTSKDLPDGPKPLDALKGSGGGDIGKAISSASDKAGEKTPDVNVPGFGPFKFNPKEDAKQAAKKSPLGFLRAAGLSSAPSLAMQANQMFLADLPSLPGSNVSKDDLPDGPKLPTSANPGAEAGQAASALGKASDKAGEKTPDVNVPGFGAFKFNPKEDAKQAAKKSPLGFMQANKMVLADLPSLPGSNVSKDDLPDGPKLPTSAKPGAEAGQAASALGKASDKAGENTPDVNVPGFGPFKFNPKEDAKQAAKKSPLGFMQANKMVLADLPNLPGANVSKDDLPDGPKPLGKLDIGGGDSAGQAASAASELSDKAGEATPDVNIPGFGTFKGNPKEDAKQAKNKASELTSSLPKPLGYMHIGELAFDLPSLPGSNVKKTDLPDGPKFPVSGGGGLDNSRQAASAVSSLSDKAGESTPDVDIPGFGTFKGNPKEDAKQAASNLSDLTSGISTPSG